MRNTAYLEQVSLGAATEYLRICTMKSTLTCVAVADDTDASLCGAFLVSKEQYLGTNNVVPIVPIQFAMFRDNVWAGKRKVEANETIEARFINTTAGDVLKLVVEYQDEQ